MGFLFSSDDFLNHNVLSLDKVQFFLAHAIGIISKKAEVTNIYSYIFFYQF